jgi:hypothetical protein
MATRKERIALNQAMFRGANERRWRRFRPRAKDKLWFRCECGNPDCAERVALTIPEYQALRENPMHFAVVGGHEIPDTEDVVDRQDRYVVVEKHEDVRDIAQRTDAHESAGDVTDRSGPPESRSIRLD